MRGVKSLSRVCQLCLGANRGNAGVGRERGHTTSVGVRNRGCTGVRSILAAAEAPDARDRLHRDLEPICLRAAEFSAVYR